MVWAVSLSTMDIITHYLTADQYTFGIRSLIMISTPRWGHHTFSALPPATLTLTLALKLFRGEPAISKFDWLFTPSHNSSANFSTLVGSVLHLVSPKLQPGHG